MQHGHRGRPAPLRHVAAEGETFGLTSKPGVGEEVGKFRLQSGRKPGQAVNRDILLAPLDVPDEVAVNIGDFGEALLRVAQFLPPAADGKAEQMAVVLFPCGLGLHASMRHQKPFAGHTL